MGSRLKYDCSPYKMSPKTPVISDEVAVVLPDLQEWAATHILARSQPANTQPTQPKDGASVNKKHSAGVLGDGHHFTHCGHSSECIA